MPEVSFDLQFLPLAAECQPEGPYQPSQRCSSLRFGGPLNPGPTQLYSLLIDPNPSFLFSSSIYNQLSSFPATLGLRHSFRVGKEQCRQMPLAVDRRKSSPTLPSMGAWRNTMNANMVQRANVDSQYDTTTTLHGRPLNQLSLSFCSHQSPSLPLRGELCRLQMPLAVDRRKSSQLVPSIGV
jgi:hypothetical protein